MSITFNDMAEILGMAKRGRVWIPGGGGRFNPIHGADLAEVCLDTVGNEDVHGQEVPAGGPDCLSMHEVAELGFKAIGTRPRISEIPPWVLGAAGRVIRPLNLNLASLVLMMSLFAGADLCCDPYGTHRLADFFRSVADRDSGDLAVEH